MKINLKILGTLTSLLLLYSATNYVRAQNNSSSTLSKLPETNDYIKVVTNEEIVGPNNLKTSCIDIARLYQSDVLKYKSMVSADGKQLFTGKEGWGGTKFTNWTPETVDFLKNQIDKCVDENSSFVNTIKRMNGRGEFEQLSPSRTKNLIDEIYEIAVYTQNFERTQEASRKQADKVAELNAIAEKERQQKIKSGALKIQNVNDACIYYSAKPLTPIIASPLLNPDNQFYCGDITIDLQEAPNLIRGKVLNVFSNNGQYPTVLPVAYAFLKTDGSTVTFNPDAMRIGYNIKAVGRYVGNAKYTTVIGVTKESPVLQIYYIGTK
ncbi:MAG: hypothetical protein ACOYB0_02585 [Polynucleobacter sp.]